MDDWRKVHTQAGRTMKKMLTRKYPKLTVRVRAYRSPNKKKVYSGILVRIAQEVGAPTIDEVRRLLIPVFRSLQEQVEREMAFKVAYIGRAE